ncbi:MAG: hypothetical protein PHI99_11595, partial [Syntrophales bacterium]|nr:hypothetical protein [Syntrophales bacterium]
RPQRDADSEIDMGEKMSCPYSEKTLEFWDGVYNPIGDACYECSNDECEHWAGEDYEDED